MRSGKSGQLEKKTDTGPGALVYISAEGRDPEREAEGWGEKEHRALEGKMEFTGPSCLLEPHRIRVVELKPHKSIQVVRGHP